MISSQLNCRFPLSLCLLLVCVGMCSVQRRTQAQAQTLDKSPLKRITEAQTRELLMQKVQLKLGETTLPVVVKALSEQTGLQIEAAGYLREHRLQMYMNGVSALTVLEILGELNDWKWQIPEPGHILIGRAQPKTPLTVMDVSLALQAALPKDLQRFVGSNSELKAAMVIPRMGQSKATANGTGDWGNPFANNIWLGIHASNMKRGKSLFEQLKPQIVDQKPLLCVKLLPEPKQALISVLVLNVFEEILTRQHDLLTGIVRPHQRDPDSIDLSVQNGNIMLIGTSVDEIRNGKRESFQTGTMYKIDAPQVGNNLPLRFGASDPVPPHQP